MFKSKIKNYKCFKYLRFWKHYFVINKNNDGRFSLKLEDLQAEMNDWGNGHTFDRHYVYHTSWAMRKIYESPPDKHIDISSDLRFSTLLSTFVPTQFYDIREIDISLPNLTTGIADLTKLPFKDNSIESVSCMHVVEHLGLGRYGDIVNPSADLIGINELIWVVKPGGKIFFVVPVGKPKIVFNAHRIYSYDKINDYFNDLHLEEFTLIPDNSNDGHLVTNPTRQLINKQEYGCGCWLFVKP